ncbi:MAG: hypothetical protein M3251_02870 [Thermoproteota archaeon]|nr:hypothetical protein [Thermoproteota archaeon]
MVLGATQTAAEQALCSTWNHLRFLSADDDLEKYRQVVMLVRIDATCPV